ncbi:ferredoxin [Streptomyces sp. NPDC059524]|uniref:ferredoxin n=1 Tax=Streptomyces sp. NPDC059524 TaxID=3346856 RepID=UPI0036A05F59
MTQTEIHAPVRFLEERFDCAQACTECAKRCVTSVGAADLGAVTAGAPRRPNLRRALLRCAEVCDATCRLLSEELRQDPYGMRLHVEWCRAVSLECAQACDRAPDAGDCAGCCRRCARACTEFLAALV